MKIRQSLEGHSHQTLPLHYCRISQNANVIAFCEILALSAAIFHTFSSTVSRCSIFNSTKADPCCPFAIFKQKFWENQRAVENQRRNYSSACHPGTFDPWVLEVVKDYQMELVQTPWLFQCCQKQVHRRNSVQCQKKFRFTSEVRTKNFSPAGSSWFKRKKDGSLRLMINLKLLNHFKENHYFKMEGTKEKRLAV